MASSIKKNIKPLKSFFLSGNSSTLTFISNDFGYHYIFSRQFEVLANKNDVLVGISAPGSSHNIIRVLDAAKKKKIKSINLSDSNGGRNKNKAFLSLIISSFSTARIQEMHIFISHIQCDLIERKLNL